ncbi:MAG: hypothetical protein JJU11_04035 [Candidatus Sumerlaeia bacterium]|nr:hypothetical protein [Candidatus Sumerlaeia bacterium]
MKKVIVGVALGVPLLLVSAGWLIQHGAMSRQFSASYFNGILNIKSLTEAIQVYYAEHEVAPPMKPISDFTYLGEIPDGWEEPLFTTIGAPVEMQVGRPYDTFTRQPISYWTDGNTVILQMSGPERGFRFSPALRIAQGHPITMEALEEFLVDRSQGYRATGDLITVFELESDGEPEEAP